jgi:hypothetical protein
MKKITTWSIYRFNPATYLSLSKVKILIHSAMSLSFFFFIFNDLRREVIVHLDDIDGIIDHQYLNFRFITICYMKSYPPFIFIWNPKVIIEGGVMNVLISTSGVPSKWCVCVCAPTK